MRARSMSGSEGRHLFNGFIAASLLAACAFFSTQARATITVDAAVGGAPTGVNYSNFNNLALGGGGGSSGGVTITFSGDAAAVQGAASGLYAAPYLSDNNGTPFGDGSNGTDTTTYLSSGAGAVTLQLANETTYLGLLWGSVDSHNVLYLYKGDTLVGSVTGSDVWSGANGDQGENGTYYVNINSTVAFDKVVATAAGYAFEFDNLAYNMTSTSVPEPEMLLIFGLLAGLTLLRRKVA